MHILTYLLIPHLVSAVAIGARDDRNRAAYFLDNNPAGSSIISLKISPEDGSLSNPIRTPTGGKGLFGLTASSTGGSPAAGLADTLFTQDSVVVSQNVSSHLLQWVIPMPDSDSVSLHRQRRQQHHLHVLHR